jgi:outer membrane lipopolysaccharide assembly protein LptE/RlpB
MFSRFISRSWRWWALFVLLIQLGCGYRLAGNLGLPPHIKTIAVPIFKNNTTEPDIEKVLTEAIIERLQDYGQLRITSTDKADAVLYGSVTSYEPHTALSFDKDFLVREYRLSLTAQVELRELKPERLIWGKKSLSAKTEYPVGADVLQTQASEQQAQRVAAFELARDLINLWE